MDIKDIMIGVCVAMIALLLMLLVALSEKVQHTERGIDMCVDAWSLVENSKNVVSDKLAECKETLGDYRNMIDMCKEPVQDNTIHYMPYNYYGDKDGNLLYDGITIEPIKPFIMKNFSWDGEFTHPPLRRINMSPEIVLLRGNCNHSDPFSPCL
jgi:hypothetical protein